MQLAVTAVCWEKLVLEGREEGPTGYLLAAQLESQIDLPLSALILKNTHPLSQLPGVRWGSLGPAPPGCSPLTSFLLPSICYYGRLFWEWGDGIHVHDSQKPQDPDKLSKEDVLSFIQTHSA